MRAESDDIRRGSEEIASEERAMTRAANDRSPERLGGVDRANDRDSPADWLGFDLKAINPERHPENCAECAVLLDDRLAGRRPRVARNTGLTSLDQLERLYGCEFIHNLTFLRIEHLLNEAGLGSRGIVFGHRGDPTSGHFFNAVNHQGTVLFLDGQAGTALNLAGFVDGEASMLWTSQ